MKVTEMFSVWFDFECRRLQRQLTDVQSSLSFAFCLRLFAKSSVNYSLRRPATSVGVSSFLLHVNYCLMHLITCLNHSELLFLISASK